MSTLRISNIEAKSVPASATIDEKVKITNSSGDVLVFLDGKTSGITTVGINTTDGNITFDANSNVVVTGIITATKFVGTFEPTNLTLTGDLLVPDKIVHTGDTNTAIRFPSADTITAETGGSERLRITSAGRVGINTTTPGTNLTVWANDSVTDTDVFQVRSKTGAFNIQVSDSDASNPEWAIRTYSNEPIVFKQATVERLRITSDGKVGVGTNTFIDGSTNFEVRGKTANTSAGGQNIHKYGSASAFHYGQFNSSGDASLNNQANANLLFATNNTERLRIGSSGETTLFRLNTFPNPNNTGSEILGGKLVFGSNISLEERYPNGAYVDRQDLVLRTNTGYGQGLSDKIRFTAGGTINFESSGGGLNFGALSNAGGMTSETLDDYEEGSWTPNIRNTGTTATWTGQTGRYVKIGQQVTVWFNADGGSSPRSGGTSSSLIMTGLPFSQSIFGNPILGSVGANKSSGTGLYSTIGVILSPFGQGGTQVRFGVGGQPINFGIDYVAGCLTYTAA